MAFLKYGILALLCKVECFNTFYIALTNRFKMSNQQGGHFEARLHAILILIFKTLL